MQSFPNKALVHIAASHGRLNNGLLQPLERPLLLWLAAHLPLRATPDMLTAIGLVGSIVVFGGYILCWGHPAFLWLANAGLIVNWFGDSLDGTLARVRRIERPKYGFFIDHTTDLFTEALFALGLGLSPYVRFDVACLALIAYLMMAAFTFVRTHVTGTLQIAFNGVGPTEMRVAMVMLNISMFVTPPKPVMTLWAPLSVVDLSILAATTVGFVSCAVSIGREARRLSREDPAHRPDVSNSGIDPAGR
jgi:archaetidylinositol phosphate synthase